MSPGFKIQHGKKSAQTILCQMERFFRHVWNFLKKYKIVLIFFAFNFFEVFGVSFKRSLEQCLNSQKKHLTKILVYISFCRFRLSFEEALKGFL